MHREGRDQEGSRMAPSFAGHSRGPVRSSGCRSEWRMCGRSNRGKPKSGMAGASKARHSAGGDAGPRERLLRPVRRFVSSCKGARLSRGLDLHTTSRAGNVAACGRVYEYGFDEWWRMGSALASPQAGEQFRTKTTMAAEALGRSLMRDQGCEHGPLSAVW